MYRPRWRWQSSWVTSLWGRGLRSGAGGPSAGRRRSELLPLRQLDRAAGALVSEGATDKAGALLRGAGGAAVQCHGSPRPRTPAELIQKVRAG
jgi:hypothetical protein